MLNGELLTVNGELSPGTPFERHAEAKGGDVYRLIRASLMSALLVLFVSLGSGAIAFDPVTPSRPLGERVPRPGATLRFVATAYCQPGVTQSGVNTRAGIAAADPAQLPVGSVVHVETDIQKYNGIYTVLDTGSRVQGHKLDLFLRNCHEARHFGKQAVRVMVLRKGWNPRASAPKAVVAGK